MTDSVLTIEDLHLSFPIYRGDVHALNRVSLDIKRVKLLAWWANQVQENPLPRCWQCVFCRKGVIAFTTGRSDCWAKMC